MTNRAIKRAVASKARKAAPKKPSMKLSEAEAELVSLLHRKVGESSQAMTEHTLAAGPLINAFQKAKGEMNAKITQFAQARGVKNNEVLLNMASMTFEKPNTPPVEPESEDGGT